MQEETDQQPPEPSIPIEKRVNRLKLIVNQLDSEEMKISLSVRVLEQVFEKVGNVPSVLDIWRAVDEVLGCAEFSWIGFVSMDTREQSVVHFA